MHNAYKYLSVCVSVNLVMVVGVFLLCGRHLPTVQLTAELPRMWARACQPHPLGCTVTASASDARWSVRFLPLLASSHPSVPTRCTCQPLVIQTALIFLVKFCKLCDNGFATAFKVFEKFAKVENKFTWKFTCMRGSALRMLDSAKWQIRIG